MNRLCSISRGGPAYLALASLGVMFFALVVNAYASKDQPASNASSPVLKTASTLKVLSTANMPLDNRAAGTRASRVAVAAADGSGGGIAGCPAGSCDLGDCTLTQSLDTATDGENQVACANDFGTTPNGWARCYNLVNEGVPAGQNLTINSVTFGVAQATINGINIDVVLYLDCNGCPPVEPGVDAEVLASQSLVVNMADVGSMITVEFPAGTVVPAGSDLIVEIVSVDDGTVPPEFFFRAMSNPNGQCGPSYIRTPDGSCGLAGWNDLADVPPGFPDAHLIQVISATVGGVVTVECPKVPEACAKGAGPCQEPHNTPGCDDVDCCAAVCNINPACCLLQWDALCVQIASKLDQCAAGPPIPCPNLAHDNGAYNLTNGGAPTAGWTNAGVIDDFETTVPIDFSCVQVGMFDNTGMTDLTTMRIQIFDLNDIDGAGGGDGTLPGAGSFAAAVPVCDNTYSVAAGTLTMFDTGDDEFGHDALLLDGTGPKCDLPPGDYGFHVTFPGTGSSDFWMTADAAGVSPDCAQVWGTDVDLPGTFCDLGPEFTWMHFNLSQEGGGDPCPWDLNESGDVGILDLLTLLASWGPCPPPCPPDFDGGGTVDIFDLLTLIANWGACP